MKEITAVIERVKQLPLYRDMNPYDINNGYCDQFADTCERILREEYEILAYADFDDGETDRYEEDLFGHVWITFNGRYFDAECPEGVDHPSKLPLFMNKGKTREQVLAERNS